MSGLSRTLVQVGSSRGFCTWGSIPPAISAGSGSIRACALFSRVDDYIAPESLFVVSRFFEDRSRFCFPFPSPALTGLFFGMSASPPRVSALLFPPRFLRFFSLPFVWFLSSFVPRRSASSFSHLWFSRSCVCTHGLVSWHGMRFPCLSSAVVFSPTFPVAYFPSFRPVFSTSVRPYLPWPKCQVRLSPVSLRFRFYHPEFGVRFCGPRCLPKRTPHHSPRAASLV